MAAALGSTKPHPVLPFCNAAASAEQIPTFVVPISAQQADEQSALDVHPPVMNCCPFAWPTFLAPALLGVSARVVAATGGLLVWVAEVRMRPRSERSSYRRG